MFWALLAGRRGRTHSRYHRARMADEDVCIGGARGFIRNSLMPVKRKLVLAPATYGMDPGQSTYYKHAPSPRFVGGQAEQMPDE